GCTFVVSCATAGRGSAASATTAARLRTRVFMVRSFLSGNGGAHGRDTEHRQPVARAEQLLDRALGVGHHPDDVAFVVRDPRDIAQGPVGAPADVAEHDASPAL